MSFNGLAPKVVEQNTAVFKTHWNLLNCIPYRMCFFIFLFCQLLCTFFGYKVFFLHVLARWKHKHAHNKRGTLNTKWSLGPYTTLHWLPVTARIQFKIAALTTVSCLPQASCLPSLGFVTSVTPLGWLRWPLRFAGKHVHRPAKFLHCGSCCLECASTWPPLAA